ncbi:urease accessory protein UreE [Polynucleobacter sp. Latsch14-2]|jgi:urease accessory protein|uniref:urease accessory protein UreE n=1 Tax=Polynucleobacter sp. Latsch14-2 TaxID=2576920 RepID=UPI001C0AE79B|nr:urease accessory protein UreE [Polynucleobacter sp. Latsch14-2]MBU3615322.1 urease accessory protein UreE [Polynucleobacter sp. Latsch14-2]
MSEPIRVEKIIPKGQGLAKAVIARALELKLPFEVRNKSRFSEMLSDGREVHFFLPRGNVLVDGDILVADDGSMIKVSAANQQVVTIASNDAHQLMKAAYHLGNRHIPTQLGKGFLRIEPDSVLEVMIGHLGLEAIHELAPFEPETGAYGGGHRHSHAETFDSDYALAQKVYAEHEKPHVHGPGCSHHHHADHDHSHEH